MRSTELILSASIRTSAPLRNGFVVVKVAGFLVASDSESVSATASGVVRGTLGAVDQGALIFAMIGIKSNACARRKIACVFHPIP